MFLRRNQPQLVRRQGVHGGTKDPGRLEHLDTAFDATISATRFSWIIGNATGSSCSETTS